jgi:hypothetical protein
VNRDNGKILPKENLEFYEFVNNKLSPKVILTIMKQRFSKFLKICKEYYRSFLVHQPKTNDFNIINVYGNRYYNEQKMILKTSSDFLR